VTAPLRVGFIGLGYMGHGMAVNIRARGFPLVVMAHRKREAVEDLVKRGATEVATPAEMAANADIIVLCVTGAEEVDALVRRPDGLGGAARAGTIIIDCTTSAPATILALARDYAGRGLLFADAPLGRSPREAWEGNLSTMVGGDPDVLERIRPVLAAFATVIQPVGALGNGHRLKLVNNFISLGLGALYSEALVLALKAGLSVEAYDDLVRSSRMHCAFYDTFMGWVLGGDADSHRFALDTALHTISDVADFAGRVEMNSQLAPGIVEIYRGAVAAGEGAAMLPSLPRHVARESGIRLVPVSSKPA
jgi:3-hydroxyisobutyrate dehydrogenase-like beta-hydroxyacid dehydrogenase